MSDQSDTSIKRFKYSLLFMSESKIVPLKTDIFKADRMHWYEGNSEEMILLDRKQVCS